MYICMITMWVYAQEGYVFGRIGLYMAEYMRSKTWLFGAILLENLMLV